MSLSRSPLPRKRSLHTLLGALALAVVTLGACGESTGPDGSVAVVHVTPVAPVLNVGYTQQLVASPTTSSGTILEGRTAAWSSSAPGVATVSGEGLVTAVAAGTTTITATVGGEAGTATITVWAPVTAITLAPAAGQSTTIRQEGSVTLVPTVTAGGAAVTGRQLVWTSSNTAVARVNSVGAVSGVADGTATITATSLIGGIVGTIPVTVSGPPVVATVTLAVTSSRFIGQGQTEQIVATPRAASGTVLSLTGRTVVWTSSNTATATVSATGLVSMLVNSGTSNITVTVDGVAQTAAIAVVGQTPLANDTPVTTSIAANEFADYVFQVPAGSDSLIVTITGGTGDPDLYVIPPTGTTCSPFLSGSNETCRFAPPIIGRYRVRVEAWGPAGAVSNVTIRARVVDLP